MPITSDQLGYLDKLMCTLYILHQAGLIFLTRVLYAAPFDVTLNSILDSEKI